MGLVVVVAGPYRPAVAFVPPSSIPSGSVTVVGTVSADVTDRAGRAVGIVTGPQTDAEFAARLPFGVTGPLTDAQLAARLPLSISGAVTGPLTDAQLAARLPLSVSVGNFPADQLVHFVTPISVNQGTSPWVVDGSAVTQPVSAASLPLPAGAATEETLDDASKALNDVALTAILQRETVT